MSKQKFWAIQANVEKKKVLCWKHRNGKGLYFTTDKKSPPPSLFSSRTEAAKAITISKKTRENHTAILFKNEIYCNKAIPVKIKVSIFN